MGVHLSAPYVFPPVHERQFFKCFMSHVSPWLHTYMQCYSQLTEWEELEKAAIINVVDLEAGETLDMIWNDPYNMVGT